MVKTNKNSGLLVSGIDDGSDVIKATGATTYDYATNPYVGCSFGCTFCYVRNQLSTLKMGGFLKKREQFTERFREELLANPGGALVIGVETDPYMPAERKAGLTRSVLETLLIENHGMTRVGIYTRSPLVTRDIDLIKALDATVHFTLSPYTEDDRFELERSHNFNTDRVQAIKALTEAGMRVIVNVAPSIPVLSDKIVSDMATLLEGLDIVEISVGLTVMYPEVRESLMPVVAKLEENGEITEILTNPEKFKAWKKQYRQQWAEAYNGDALIIWRDTIPIGWRELKTMAPLPESYYTKEKQHV